MTAALATPPESTTQTVETRYVTATLTETAEGWTITAISKQTHRTYTFAVARCCCREQAQAKYDEAVRKGSYAMFGAHRPRAICPLPFGASHGGVKCRDFDHCYSRGHRHHVDALFAGVVRTYAPKPHGPMVLLRQVAGERRITAGKYERQTYLAWLRENDPDADNPYASAS